MFKNQIRAFFVGAVPLVLTFLLRQASIGQIDADTAKLLAAGVLVVTLFLYLFTDRVLRKQQWFRRIVFPTLSKFEGDWATDLSPPDKKSHGTYPYSFAELRYDDEHDRFTYSGVAFSKNDVGHGKWEADTFLYDRYSRKFVFTSYGVGPDRSTRQNTKNDAMAATRVQSFGLLKPVSGNRKLEGSVVDLGAATPSSSDLNHLTFDMELHRITRADRKAALGVEIAPTNDAQKVSLIKQALRRVGRQN